jgi:ABC-type Mn2+/Zn2+ transport system permease subunit
MTGWFDSAVHRAFIEAALVGALGGMIGVYVIVRRLSFFTMALTHATFPGVVLASLLGLNLYLGGGLFGILIACAVAGLSRGRDLTTATGITLAGGFALGVVLVSAQPGFSRDLTAYTVGDILTVTTDDLAATTLVLILLLMALIAGGKELLFAAFDPVGASAAGYRTTLLDLLLLILIEITVVTAVPALGAILALALIVGPAATARLLTDRLDLLFPIAVAIGVACGITGIWISTRIDVAAGGSIALLIGSVFTTVLCGSSLARTQRRRHQPTGHPSTEQPLRSARRG